jgi:hypothetical protein
MERGGGGGRGEWDSQGLERAARDNERGRRRSVEICLFFETKRVEVVV